MPRASWRVPWLLKVCRDCRGEWAGLPGPAAHAPGQLPRSWRSRPLSLPCALRMQHTVCIIASCPLLPTIFKRQQNCVNLCAHSKAPQAAFSCQLPRVGAPPCSAGSHAPQLACTPAHSALKAYTGRWKQRRGREQRGAGNGGCCDRRAAPGSGRNTGRRRKRQGVGAKTGGAGG